MLRFAHPLLASAVYADVGAGERAALHRRTAEILRDEEIAPVRVAAHLLPSAGSGEQWVVDVLCAAANRALGVGAPESAASYLRRALDEPPSLSARATVLRQLGLCEATTDLPAAIAHFEEALATDVEDRDRAYTLLVLGRARSCNGEHSSALAAFEEAAQVEGTDASLVAQASAEAVALGLLTASAARSCSPTTRPGPRSPPARWVPEQRMLLAALCLHEAMRGDSCETVCALASRALDGEATARRRGRRRGARRRLDGAAWMRRARLE